MDTDVAAAPQSRAAGIAIADSALERLQELLENRPGDSLRIAVKGGGCSGLSYKLEWAQTPRERDKIFERNGVKIFVDSKSYLYLMGTELIYEDTMASSGFRLRNPNEKTSCGCGMSFTV